MSIRWTPTALAGIESLHAFIALDNPEAAAGTVDRVGSAIDMLCRHPDLGRKGRVRGTRELILAPYVVACRVNRGTIEVLAVIHGARRWLDSF